MTGKSSNALTHSRTCDSHVTNNVLTCQFTLGRDRLTRDDAIGTTFLNLSQMSSSGGEIEGNYVFIFLLRLLRIFV